MILAYEEGQSVELIEFDVTLRESFDLDASIPAHPVEQGADVADHVVPAPRKMTAVVIVTDTPIREPATQAQGARRTTEDRDVDVGSVLVVDKPSEGGAPAEAHREAIETRPRTSGFAEEFSRVERVIALLDSIRSRALRCTVFTDVAELDGMHIAKVSVPRTRSKSAQITIELVQVTTAESQSVELPDPVEPRARRTRDAGRQTTKEITDAPTQERARRSFLHTQFMGGA